MGTEATAMFEMPLFLSHDIMNSSTGKTTTKKKSEYTHKNQMLKNKSG